MKLIRLPETFAIVKCSPELLTIPDWADRSGELFSVTWTSEELSIVCPDRGLPQEAGSDMQVERGWKCLKVEGPLDFGLTGIMYRLTKPLAEKEISIFALSTYNTDYLMVKKERWEAALDVLAADGHIIV